MDAIETFTRNAVANFKTAINNLVLFGYTREEIESLLGLIFEDIEKEKKENAR